MREGSEEYLDSEKYETKTRKLDGPLLPLVKTLNTIRRESPALQRLEGVDFLETENENLIAYVRRALDNLVIVVVNLDPRSAQEGFGSVVPVSLGLPPAYSAEELLLRDDFPLARRAQLHPTEPGQSHILQVQ